MHGSVGDEIDLVVGYVGDGVFGSVDVDGDVVGRTFENVLFVGAGEGSPGILVDDTDAAGGLCGVFGHVQFVGYFHHMVIVGFASVDEPRFGVHESVACELSELSGACPVDEDYSIVVAQVLIGA